MQIELKIKHALRWSDTPKKKALNINKFMKWDEEKLIKSIEKHGISSDKRRSMVVSEFWGKK